MCICINVSVIVVWLNMAFFAAIIPACKRYLNPTRCFVGSLISRRYRSTEQCNRLDLEKGCWQVSSHGRVCSTQGVVSYGSLRVSGYYRAKILGNDFYVHRLVAFTFIGPPPNAYAWQVHHLDGNPSNNRLDNLEYVTQQENVKHSFDNPSRGCGGAKRSRPVMWRPRGSQSWTMCESGAQAAKQLGISQGFVCKCCRGAAVAKNFEIQFAEKDQDCFPGEEWKPLHVPSLGTLADAPGRMVGSYGQIKCSNGRISRGYRSRQGYFLTTLAGFNTTFLVHRLVAAAFLGQPPTAQHTQINHKDGNKGNNAVANLEYVTPAENILHYHSYAGSSKVKRGKAVESRLAGSNHTWITHPSISKAAQMLGVHACNIRACLKGLQKQTGGFEFRLPPGTAQKLPHEEWRKVDTNLLLKERLVRCWGMPRLLRGSLKKDQHGSAKIPVAVNFIPLPIPIFQPEIHAKLGCISCNFCVLWLWGS